jgi:hypothetical protein
LSGFPRFYFRIDIYLREGFNTELAIFQLEKRSREVDFWRWWVLMKGTGGSLKSWGQFALVVDFWQRWLWN